VGTRASRNQFIVREKAAFTASGVADPEGQAHDPTQPSRGVVSTSNMGKKDGIERLSPAVLEQLESVGDRNLGGKTRIDRGKSRRFLITLRACEV